jgi:hypothetical protein
MGLVLRVRVGTNPARVWVKAVGLLLEGYPEDLLLFDAQCRYASLMGVLPEDVTLVVFRDVSWEGERDESGEP